MLGLKTEPPVSTSQMVELTGHAGKISLIPTFEKQISYECEASLLIYIGQCSEILVLKQQQNKNTTHPNPTIKSNPIAGITGTHHVQLVLGISSKTSCVLGKHSSISSIAITNRLYFYDRLIQVYYAVVLGPEPRASDM